MLFQSCQLFDYICHSYYLYHTLYDVLYDYKDLLIMIKNNTFKWIKYFNISSKNIRQIMDFSIINLK